MFNNSSTGTQVLLVLASLTVVIAGLKAASSIVVPLLMAIFLAIISAAMLQWLQRRGLPLWAAMTLVLLLLASTLVTLGSLIGASINQFSSALPRYEAQLNSSHHPDNGMARGLGIKLPAVASPNSSIRQEPPNFWVASSAVLADCSPTACSLSLRFCF